MDSLDFSRSQALNNIPQKKLAEYLSAIENGGGSQESKTIKLIAINRYAESNIPIEYWSLKMERDFQGDPRLLAKYNEYVADLKASYISGQSICFACSCELNKSISSCQSSDRAFTGSVGCLSEHEMIVRFKKTEKTRKRKYLK